MSINTTVMVHNGDLAYTERPPISINLAVGDIVRSGNTISCTITNASVNALGGESHFGYPFTVLAQLDNGTVVELWSKGSSPNQWSAGAYNISGSKTVSSTNTGTSATFKILLNANCTCTGHGGNQTVWQTTVSAPPSNVTVTFDLDGGIHTGGGALTQSVAIGGSAVAPTCTRSQCNFIGWDKSLTNIQSSQTITAIWDYIINYDTSELEAITIQEQIKHKNETLILSNINLSSENPGYQHTGWATSRGGSATYSLGGNYTANAPDTLYPAWGQSTETFTVTFDLRGGISSGGGSLTQTVRYGNSATPPSNPTKTGRRFSGWLGDYTNVTSNRTIYALWDSSPLWIFTGSQWIPFSG